MTIEATIAALAQRMRAPGSQSRPADAATAKQLAYLTKLIQQHGKIEYRRLKAELGIDATLPRLTRREAWLLIHHMTEESPRE